MEKRETRTKGLSVPPTLIGVPKSMMPPSGRDEATNLIRAMDRLLPEIQTEGPSSSLLLYTLLQLPGTTAHTHLLSLPDQLRARILVQTLRQAQQVNNPCPIDHFRWAAERVQRDLCGDPELDSRHFLLSCLVGKAFLGPDPCVGRNDHLTDEQLIGNSKDAVIAMKDAGVDVLSLIGNLRRTKGLNPPAFNAASFLVVLPDLHNARFRVFKMEEVGEFQYTDFPNLRFPASMGLLPDSTTKYLDAVSEFEDLLNASSTRELDFQKFFELHPDFLSSDEHVSAKPGVLLSTEKDYDLKPDFFLQRRDTSFWDLAELKLHTETLARGRDARRGLSAAVHSACDQLREYREYFFDPRKADEIKDKHGINVFFPRLTLIIGRDSGFGSFKERQRIVPPELRLLTYDDVLRFAKHRSVVLPFSNAIAEQRGQPEQR